MADGITIEVKSMWELLTELKLGELGQTNFNIQVKTSAKFAQIYLYCFGDEKQTPSFVLMVHNGKAVDNGDASYTWVPTKDDIEKISYYVKDKPNFFFATEGEDEIVANSFKPDIASRRNGNCRLSGWAESDVFKITA